MNPKTVQNSPRCASVLRMFAEFFKDQLPTAVPADKQNTAAASVASGSMKAG